MDAHLELSSRTDELMAVPVRERDDSVPSIPPIGECLTNFDRALAASPLYKENPLAAYNNLQIAQRILNLAVLICETSIPIEDDETAKYIAQVGTRVILDPPAFMPQDVERLQAYVQEKIDTIDRVFNFSKEPEEQHDKLEQATEAPVHEVIDFTSFDYWQKRLSKFSVFTVEAIESGDPDAIEEQNKIYNMSRHLAALFRNDELEDDSAEEVQEIEFSLICEQDIESRFAANDAINERFDYIEEKSHTSKPYKKILRWLTTNENKMKTEPSLENLEYNLQGKREQMFIRDANDAILDEFISRLERNPGLVLSFGERIQSGRIESLTGGFVYEEDSDER